MYLKVVKIVSIVSFATVMTLITLQIVLESMPRVIQGEPGDLRESNKHKNIKK